MTPMLSLLASLLVVTAGLGAGALVLAATRTLDGRPNAERLAMAFAIGTGVLGWLGFFAALGGLVDSLSLIMICAALVPGVILLKGRRRASPAVRFDAWSKILLAAIAVAMVFNLLEGLSPPVDADSLAYHFALPKMFLAQGRLVFVPRAADGAVPLLQQMTYMTALGIGGERALTLWSMFGGWGAAALVYAISRRHLNVNWSLVVALAFLTTPAVVYGSGNGQVEVTNAMFTLAAAVAVADALATGRIGYAVVAGLLAGFFAGSKYTGLAVAFSLGLTVLFQRRWLAHGAALSAAFLIAGSQWYAWNWWNTGDPLFPMLYGLVQYREGFPWNQAQNTFFKNMMDNYRGVPANLWWLLLYPFKATLDPLIEFQSLRIGFGPYVLVMLPLALVTLWRRRRRLIGNPLTVYGAVVMVSYVLWFFLLPSQLVRHFLPLYPLLLICVTVAAQRAIGERAALVRPAVWGLGAVLLMQVAGQGLFTLNYARHILSGEDHDAFLARNVTGYAVAEWINKNLGPEDRVLVPYRQMIYLIDVPTFYAQTAQQAVIELRPDNLDAGRLWRQLRSLGITYILDETPSGAPIVPGIWNYTIRDLAKQGCLEQRIRFKTPVYTSRTLPSYNYSRREMVLWRMVPNACRFEPAAGNVLSPDTLNDRN